MLESSAGKGRVLMKDLSATFYWKKANNDATTKMIM